MKFVVALFLSPHLSLANAKVGKYHLRTNPKPVVGKLGFYGSNPQHTLGQCEGDCDTDLDCRDELVCFQRGAYDEVPGCLGGLQDGSLTDYCVLKSDLNIGLENITNMPLNYTMDFPLGRCEGDCDTNDDCQGDLICFQRNENVPVPGCIGGERDGSRTDYCVPPSSVVVPPETEEELNIQWSIIFPLTRCQGDCDSDFDCEGELVCFQRDANVAVPGCAGGESDGSKTDYCVRPEERKEENNNPDPPVFTSKFDHISWSTDFPLGKCQGDCDYNHDCQDGLICWQRSGGEEIYGCRGSDDSGTDFCIPKENAPAKKLKLYWEPGFYWQESTEETYWCMTCTACESLTTGDGWEGGCVTPEHNKCEEGHLMWIQHCSDTMERFEILENPNSGNQIRVFGTNLCLSSIHNRFIILKPCDSSKSEQLWASMPNRDKFEIRPYHERNLSADEAECVSQLHHPKPTEVMALRSCQENIIHTTNHWTEYYG